MSPSHQVTSITLYQVVTVAVLTKAFYLHLIPVFTHDLDANGAILHEVHPVGSVSLPDDQLAVDEAAREQGVREVGALIRLGGEIS